MINTENIENTMKKSFTLAIFAIALWQKHCHRRNHH